MGEQILTCPLACDHHAATGSGCLQAGIRTAASNAPMAEGMPLQTNPITLAPTRLKLTSLSRFRQQQSKDNLTKELHNVWMPNRSQAGNLPQEGRGLALLAHSYSLHCHISPSPHPQECPPKHALSQKLPQCHLKTQPTISSLFQFSHDARIEEKLLQRT